MVLVVVEPKSMLELAAKRSLEKGPIQPQLSEAVCLKVGFKPDQLGTGKTHILLQAEMAGDCLLLLAVLQRQPVSSFCLQRGEETELGCSTRGHLPAPGEQGLKGAELLEQDPTQLQCLVPYLFSSLQSNINATCAQRAKLPFMASAAKKADEPEHLHLQSSVLHKRQGQTENMCFVFANLNDLY